jgi:hypothetical protein
MKSVKEILDNYKDYETQLDDRFGSRFTDFLTIEEMENIGFELKEEYKKDWQPKEWTKENVINQLKEDIEFGIEKAQSQRGISSGLMFSVVRSWLKVLEDKELLTMFEDYDDYGLSAFKQAKQKYIKEK